MTVASARPERRGATAAVAAALGETDFHLFAEGTHARLYDKLGAHPSLQNGAPGTRFALWAPNAAAIDVIGDWNGWQPDGASALAPLGQSGLWQGVMPAAGVGQRYKFRVRSRFGGYVVDKADPFAFAAEPAPATASVIADLTYQWGDAAWLAERRDRQRPDRPISIYELHLGSWMRDPGAPERLLSYRELAPKVVEHVQRLGFTHVELMPVAEHPFYGSWGYQVTSFFAPTPRYGGPTDFMFLVDTLHQNGIGVILDWTPAHFPENEHGLIYFDGTHLFEHADPRQGHHPEWGSAIFNYDRHEVRSFLLSNALFWLDRYHVDGLRVDAVASMLYLDYGRKPGEWVANSAGGRENFCAVALLRKVNETVHRQHPGALTIAEESTTWPGVSRPAEAGGLGFDYKWDMGWMHDTLAYLAVDPVYRRHHHHKLTFRGLYAASENFVLPLSHDEVVYGKRSLLEKLPGDDWQRFATMRLLLTYMWCQTGKKLLFMGGEFGQRREWNHDRSLDWHLLREDPRHAQLQLLISELNRLYQREPALHERDTGGNGLEWIVADDVENSVYAFVRHGQDIGAELLAVFNATPVPRFNYRIGLTRRGLWSEVINTDGEGFGGSNHGNFGSVEVAPVPAHGRPFSLNLTLPPLGALVLKPFV